MPTIAEVITDLRARGLRVSVNAEGLLSVGPRSRLSPEDRETIAAAKTEMIDFLRASQVPASSEIASTPELAEEASIKGRKPEASIVPEPVRPQVSRNTAADLLRNLERYGCRFVILRRGNREYLKPDLSGLRLLIERNRNGLARELKRRRLA